MARALKTTAPGAEPPGPRRPVSRLPRRGLFLASALTLGLLVHAAFFVLVSIPLGPGPEEVRSEAWISWRGGTELRPDPLTREQSLLLDTEPLFVPTRWNAASSLDEIARLRDETELFPPFSPQLGTGTGIWTPPLPPSTGALLEQRAAAATASPPFRLLGVGPPDAPEPATRYPARIEVFSLSSGDAVGLPAPFEAAGEPPPAAIWTPLEFLVVIDPATVGGLPLRLNSSGSPEWDRAVTQALQQEDHLRRLPHGYFRIVVGP